MFVRNFLLLFLSAKNVPDIFSCKANFLNFYYFLKPLKILISPLPLVSTKMRLFSDMSKSLGARQKTQIFSLEFQDGLQAVLRLVNSLLNNGLSEKNGARVHIQI